MPERETLERAKQDARQGKSASTQAGEFVREEMHHVREGKHGVRSTKQAIAIGLSKARRAGVDLPPPGEGHSDEERQHATQDLQAGKEHHEPSPRRSRAVLKALKREGHAGASKRALSKHARQSARARSPKARSRQAKRAARTRRRSTR
jgi:hypothetical protein